MGWNWKAGTGVRIGNLSNSCVMRSFSHGPFEVPVHGTAHLNNISRLTVHVNIFCLSNYFVSISFQVSVYFYKLRNSPYTTWCRDCLAILHLLTNNKPKQWWIPPCFWLPPPLCGQKGLIFCMGVRPHPHMVPFRLPPYHCQNLIHKYQPSLSLLTTT